MDGKKNGSKPYEQMDDLLGIFHPYFFGENSHLVAVAICWPGGLHGHGSHSRVHGGHGHDHRPGSRPGSHEQHDAQPLLRRDQGRR